MNEEDKADEKDLAVLVAIGKAIKELKDQKPNDRSEKDRRYQIAITDLEKVWATFYALVYNDVEIFIHD